MRDGMDKAQLPLGENTSSQILEPAPNQRAQKKPTQRVSGCTRRSTGRCHRAGAPALGVALLPTWHCSGVRACLVWPGSPACRAPWGTVGCGVVGVGQQARGMTHDGHPKAHRQGPTAQHPALTGSTWRGCWSAQWTSRGGHQLMKPTQGCVASGGMEQGPSRAGCSYGSWWTGPP